MSFAEELKAKLINQTRIELFDASKKIAATTAGLGDGVTALFQNPGTPPEDFATAQADLETKLGAALDDYTAIIRIGADLARGKLPA